MQKRSHSHSLGTHLSEEYTIHINFRKDDITTVASLPGAATVRMVVTSAAPIVAVGHRIRLMLLLLCPDGVVVVGIGERRIVVRGGKLLLTLSGVYYSATATVGHWQWSCWTTLH